MNPTTNQQQNQQASPQAGQQGQDPTIKANQAAASLSFATHLSTQLMQHKNPKQEEAPQETQQEEPKQEADPKVAELETKVSEMEKKMEETVNKKFEELKQTITDALSEDEQVKA